MLTDLACKSLIAQAKKQNRKIKKADTHSLFLYAFPKGSAYWRYKYRFHGKEKSLSFGSFPQVSLREARCKRDDAYKTLLDGKDPSKLRQDAARIAKAEGEKTFQAVAVAWFEHSRKRWKRASHARTVCSILEKDLFPAFGSNPITELSRKDIKDALQKIEARGSLHMAQRALQFIKQVLDYARINEDLIEYNVALGLEKILKHREPGQFASIEVKDLPKLLADIRAHKMRPIMRDVLELFMLTLVRRMELFAAPWTEFDLDNAVWIIPAERMKKGNDHIVPLSRQALAILQRLYAENRQKPPSLQSPYVFPSFFGPYRHLAPSHGTTVLMNMGYRDRHTVHGYRALGMGIAMEKLGYAFEIPDRQLAHVPAGRIRKAYDRAQYLDQRKEMMQRLADYIDSQR